jgi:peptidoglycan/LPS O-acetylase OafA/YrhL
MRYRAEIDGLRSVAVLPVILFHAGFDQFSGGFIGVDVFFVVSGFLITSILIEDLEQGRFSLLTFYERRARRILPALFFVMACCLPFAWVYMLPNQLHEFFKSVVATSLFSSNVLFWLETGYFSAAAEEKPLLHTWSLAVEEQYYIFFPILLAILWRWGLRATVWTVALLTLASLAAAELMTGRSPAAGFFLIPTRAWELFAGSLAAFLVHRKGVMGNQVLSLSGLVAIAASVVLYDKTTPFPSIYAILPVAGTVTVLICADGSTWAGRALSQRPMVALGLISYSAYLWHQPLFAFARLRVPGHPDLWTMMALAVLSLVLAAATWRLVEQPFRVRQVFVGWRLPRPELALGVAGLAAFAGIGVWGYSGKGFADRFDRPEFVREGQFALANEYNGYCLYPPARSGVIREGPEALCPLGAPDEEPRVLIFGDSLAGQWEPMWDNLGRTHGFALHSLTTNWCFPALDSAYTAPHGHISRRQCAANRSLYPEIASNYDVIVMGGGWPGVQRQGFAPSVHAVIRATLRDTDAQLLILDTPVPLLRDGVEMFVYGLNASLKVNEEPEALNQEFWTMLRTSFINEKRVAFVSRDELFSTGESGIITADGWPYSLDGTHVSTYGALESAESLNSFSQGGFARLLLTLGLD